MRWRKYIATAVALLLVGTAAAWTGEVRPLDIYFLDMAGGGSTLIVTPLGESVLIDTGSREPMHRDVNRICRACEDAGIDRIDHLITTHFHSDHYGGLLELTRRMPVGTFWDKGALPPQREQESRSFKELYPLYQRATGGTARAILAGDDLPLRDDPSDNIPPVRLHCVASEKRVEGFEGDVDAPVEGGEIRKPDTSDNGRSIALLLTHGPFEFFAGGDITWNVEHHLVHPVNRIGKVDLYQVTHHGLDHSNNPFLLEALSPTVAVAMNGPRKGIQPRTFRDLTALPSLEALYQIHYNTQHDGRFNAAPEFIANPHESPYKGEFIKASVHLDEGIFTVQTGTQGRKRRYTIRP